MARISFIFALITCFSLSAHAERVYKYTDESGNTVFTDEPVKGAEQLDVQPVATIPAIPVPKSTAPTAQAEEFTYTKVAVTQPADQENFVNNEGTATVQVSIEPNLRGGDVVQLYFNGIPQGEPKKGTAFPFKNLDRGEYKTHVVIFDKDGKEAAKSDAISFFIKRAALKKQVRPH